jgi:PKD repeat protein
VGNPATHTYGSAGNYTVNVTVDDGHGHTRLGSLTITVAERTGLSNTVVIIIVAVIVILVLLMAVGLSRRKKPEQPAAPPPPSQ